MRTEDLLDAIGGVDDELLQRSEKIKIKKETSWKKWMPLAACLCLVLGLGFLVFPHGFGMGSKDAAMESLTDNFFGDAAADGAAAPEEDVKDTMNGGSASCDGKKAFDNIYALSMAEPNDAIYAIRQVGINFVKTDTETVIEMEDSYTLFNTSGEDIEAEFAYMYSMDHNGTRPVFVDEEGNEFGKAGSPIHVTIPANDQLTIKGQYSKSMTLDEEFVDWYVHGCQFTNLDVREASIAVSRESDVETIKIDPIEDFYLD